MRKKLKYISIFSLSTLFLLIGLLVGEFLAEYKLSEFSNFATQLKTSLLSIDTQEKIAEEFLCEIDIFALTEERAKLGRTLTYLELKYGKNDERVINLKKEYSLLSIRQWLLVKRFKEKCKRDLNIILFFYSNERNVSESEAQGFILDFIYRKYPERVIIYALDFDLDSKAIDSLEEIYNITRIPSLVINEKTYDGFVPKEKIESIIQI